MSIDAAKELIKHAQADLAQALIELDTAPTPEPPSSVVHTPQEFDAALAAATAGSTIVCATALVYPNALTLSKSVTVKSEQTGTARLTTAEPAPRFTGGLTIRAANV